jgi:hypothetical protein
MYYYLIIAIQAFCIYHLFKNRNDYYWILVIVFLPLIGCVIYLVTQVYNKRDVEKIHQDITTIINPTKKVKDLEKKLQFSETYQNRVNLADAFFEIKDFDNAINHYQMALKKTSLDDFHIASQLMVSFYQTDNFGKVIELAQNLQRQPDFKKSQAQFIYGMALARVGKVSEAEKQLEQLDLPYSNYNERLAYINFLIGHNKTEMAKTILDEVYNETQNMTKMNRQIYRTTIFEIEKLKQGL